MRTEQTDDLYQRSYPIMKLYNNLFHFKAKKIGIQILGLVLLLFIPVMLSYILKEVDPAILFGGMFGGLLTALPVRYNEQNYREIIIKYLNKHRATFTK